MSELLEEDEKQIRLAFAKKWAINNTRPKARVADDKSVARVWKFQGDSIVDLDSVQYPSLHDKVSCVGVADSVNLCLVLLSTINNEKSETAHLAICMCH